MSRCCIMGRINKNTIMNVPYAIQKRRGRERTSAGPEERRSLTFLIQPEPGVEPGRVNMGHLLRRIMPQRVPVEALGLVVGTQGVHQRRELAVHDVGKLMQRQAD